MEGLLVKAALTRVDAEPIDSRRQRTEEHHVGQR